MMAALRRLWGWINENNSHCVGFQSDRTVPQMFTELQKCGALQTLLQRLFVLENLCCDVEFRTRGLYRKSVDWNALKITDPTELEPSYGYLSCDVSLHENREFADEWQNGEQAWLDLVTGETETY